MKTPRRLPFALCAVWLAPAAFAQPAGPARIPAAQPAAQVSARAERLESGKTRLSVRPPTPVPDGYKLLDAAGKEITGVVRRAGAIEAVVESQRGYILAPTTNQRRPMTKQGVEMPARYINLTRDGQTLLGGLFLRPTRIPLIWDSASGAYATELVVGYEFVDGAERPLAAPKTINFFTEGSDARIQADTVVIERSGGSGYKRVRLTTRQGDGETLFTARAGPADELRSSVAVHREPGALRLSLAPRDVPGLGIGTATLAVSLLARDGLALPATMPVNLQLSSRRLRHAASAVIPTGRSSVEVEVRSAGLGTDAISVSGGGLEASQPVQLMFPVAATLAALVGGVCGGTARYLRNRRKRGTLLLRRIGEGALVGVIVVGAAWTGLLAIDFNAGVLGTPFGAFVLAALAGYLGCVLLDRIAAKTFGRLRPSAEPAP